MKIESRISGIGGTGDRRQKTGDRSQKIRNYEDKKLRIIN